MSHATLSSYSLLLRKTIADSAVATRVRFPALAVFAILTSYTGNTGPRVHDGRVPRPWGPWERWEGSVAYVEVATFYLVCRQRPNL